MERDLDHKEFSDNKEDEFVDYVEIPEGTLCFYGECMSRSILERAILRYHFTFAFHLNMEESVKDSLFHCYP